MRQWLVLAPVLVPYLACSKPPPTPLPAPIDAGDTSETGESGGGRGEHIGIGSSPASMQVKATVHEGSVTRELVERVVRNDEAVRKCYRRAHGSYGAASFDLTIAVDGKTKGVRAETTSLDPEATKCLASAIGAITFPDAPPGFRASCEIHFARALPAE